MHLKYNRTNHWRRNANVLYRGVILRSAKKNTWLIAKIPIYFMSNLLLLGAYFFRPTCTVIGSRTPSVLTASDHKHANNNHILTPWDGKALQFGCLGGLPGFLKHVLPQESRCGKKGKSLQCQCVHCVWKLNGRRRFAPAPMQLWNTMKRLTLQWLTLFPAMTFQGQNVL